jgi:putative Ca2+/H+ antiporter (TMEM165/GDT1 family)
MAMKPYLLVFLTVFLAELGDKTQLATLLFSANPEVTRLGVFAAAAGALVLSTAVAVAVGSALGEWLAPQHLRIAAGVGFIAIGAWMLFQR